MEQALETAGWRDYLELTKPRVVALMLLTAVIGCSVGTLAGLAGVGGGFLVVPALIVFAGLPVRKAIGTATLVLAMTGASGAAGHLLQGHVPAGLAIAFAVGAAAGAPPRRRPRRSSYHHRFG